MSPPSSARVSSTGGGAAAEAAVLTVVHASDMQIDVADAWWQLKCTSVDVVQREVHVRLVQLVPSLASEGRRLIGFLGAAEIVQSLASERRRFIGSEKKKSISAWIDCRSCTGSCTATDAVLILCGGGRSVLWKDCMAGARPRDAYVWASAARFGPSPDFTRKSGGTYVQAAGAGSTGPRTTGQVFQKYQRAFNVW